MAYNLNLPLCNLCGDLKNLSRVIVWISVRGNVLFEVERNKLYGYQPLFTLLYQYLEKACLSGITSSRSRGDKHIHWGDSTNPRRGGHSVYLNNFPNFLYIPIGEDKSHITADVGNELFIRMSWVFLHVVRNDFPYHRILTHEHFTFSPQAEPYLRVALLKGYLPPSLYIYRYTHIYIHHRSLNLMPLTHFHQGPALIS